MSERTIQVGDLVQVVRPRTSCGCGGDLGMVYQVMEIVIGTTTRCCRECGFESTNHNGLIANGVGIDGGRGLCRLKRIPPLSELEGAKTEEGIRVPAQPKTKV